MKIFTVIALGLSMAACAGPKGEQGIVGEKGPAGASGLNCTVSNVSSSDVAPNGGALVQCPDNQVLLLNGANGAAGTVVTPLQFCPDSSASYPSTFPEFGFKINGAIYAVYSANGGFLSLLSPGTYSSNGINSSCTFTVNTDATISN